MNMITSTIQAKNAIQNMSCEIHCEKPAIAIDDEKISFTTCCEEFAKKVNEKIDYTMKHLEFPNIFGR